MSAAITGAAIGFLVWSAWFWKYATNSHLILGTGLFSAFVAAISGAAIGWLIGGGA